jgi:hypothetical protein
MNTGGKGSKARPLSIPRNQFEDNWDRIFGKKQPKKSTGVDKSRRKQNEKVIAE